MVHASIESENSVFAFRNGLQIVWWTVIADKKFTRGTTNAA